MSTQQRHILGYGTLIGVWAALIVLTLVTVAVSRVDLGPFNVWLALFIASCKSALVIAFFMHLKYEGWLLRLFLFLTLATLAVFIGVTFVDVYFR